MILLLAQKHLLYIYKKIFLKLAEKVFPYIDFSNPQPIGFSVILLVKR